MLLTFSLMTHSSNLDVFILIRYITLQFKDISESTRSGVFSKRRRLESRISFETLLTNVPLPGSADESLSRNYEITYAVINVNRVEKYVISICTVISKHYMFTLQLFVLSYQRITN